MFISGKDYYRNELLTFVGSQQQQSGIIWGNIEPTCVIITSGGRGGKSMGYSNIQNKDGSFTYIGQGEKGDQDLNKFANSLLINGERSVLFFSTHEPNAEEVRKRGDYRKLYTFAGIFEVASWDYIQPIEGKRAGDKLLRFLLIPANNIFNIQAANIKDSDAKEKEDSLTTLRKKIKEKGSKPSKGITSLGEYYKRSQEIVIYAKIRANGVCECCNKPAPFLDGNNLPFLEVHHILKLADDGPDEPENVSAVCPNCHREAHYGSNKEQIKISLIKTIIEKEMRLLLPA